MDYKRCARCELNFILKTEPFCAVCLKELAGQYDDGDDGLSEDLCPYCEKRSLEYGESRCRVCLDKLQEKDNP